MMLEEFKAKRRRLLAALLNVQRGTSFRTTLQIELARLRRQRGWCV
jgi:hypothetical protein